MYMDSVSSLNKDYCFPWGTRSDTNLVSSEVSNIMLSFLLSIDDGSFELFEANENV